MKHWKLFPQAWWHLNPNCPIRAWPSKRSAVPSLQVSYLDASVSPDALASTHISPACSTCLCLQFFLKQLTLTPFFFISCWSSVILPFLKALASEPWPTTHICLVISPELWRLCPGLSQRGRAVPSAGSQRHRAGIGLIARPAQGAHVVSAAGWLLP